MTNIGVIAGGAGGYNLYFVYPRITRVFGPGGSGAIVTNGSLTNKGLISGGSAGGHSSGGTGVELTSATLNNDGRIAGGGGGIGNRGGAGVEASSSVLINNGTITGGRNGGTGVDASQQLPDQQCNDHRSATAFIW